MTHRPWISIIARVLLPALLLSPPLWALAACPANAEGGFAAIDALEPIAVVTSGDRDLAVLGPAAPAAAVGEPAGAPAVGWPRFLMRERPDACRWLPVPDRSVEPVEVATGERSDRGMEVIRRTVADFARTAAAEGTATALHVYLLDAALQLSIDGTATFEGAAEVNPFLTQHPIDGLWHTDRLGRVPDGPWMIAEGTLADPHGGRVRRFLTLWQYDPRVANYGLRLLWFGLPSEGPAPPMRPARDRGRGAS